MGNKPVGFLPKWWWLVGIGVIISIGALALQTNLEPKPLLGSIRTGSIVRDGRSDIAATKHEQRQIREIAM